MALKLLAHDTGWRGIEVAIVAINDFGEVTGITEPLAIKAVPPGTMIDTPTLSGPEAQMFLQSALETAWRMGLRPTNWRDERPGEIKAMGAHLEDMRRLVFGPVNLPNPLDALRRDRANVG